MNRKTANIILKVFVSICIVASTAFTLLFMLKPNAWQDHRSTIIQLVIWLIISVALWLYIFCVRNSHRHE